MRKGGKRGKEGGGGKREVKEKGQEEVKEKEGQREGGREQPLPQHLSFLSLTSAEKKDYLFKMRGGERGGEAASFSLPVELLHLKANQWLTLASRVKPE